ncbi:MAG: hypothetical protein QW797_08155 [Thermoproteota archaeon]
MLNCFKEEELTETESEKVFKCSNCSKPLNYTPETIACVCEYCGTINWFSEERFDVFIMLTHTRDEVVNAFWNGMKHDPDMGRAYGEIELVEAQGFYVPIILCNVSVEGGWGGTERRYKIIYHKSGVFSIPLRLAVEAKREAAEYGLQELINQAKSVNDPQPLASVEWKKIGLPVLNIELLPQEAEDELKDIVEHQIRDDIRLLYRLSELNYFCIFATHVVSFRILLAPLWILVYKYRGEMYRVSISGYNLQFLRVSKPAFTGQRIPYPLVGIILALIINTFSYMPLFLVGHPTDEGLFILGFTIYILSYFLPLFVGIFLAKKYRDKCEGG